MNLPEAQEADVEQKGLYHGATKEVDNSDSDQRSESLFQSTSNDVSDMKRMGKTQELRRTFRRISSFSFVCVLTATWEFLFIANATALTDGGRPGLFYTFIWTAIGMGTVMASLAEMSSMAPTSGGQYHWVSEFAPREYQRSLSYTSGWLSTLAWQASTASGGTLTGGIIQGLITLYNPDYTAPRWQLCLIAIANVVFINVFNVYAARVLAPMQNPLMLLHVFSLVAIIIVLWVLAPHPSAYEVFAHFENSGGWQTTGLALCVGQISPLFGLICGDSAAHMSEEVKDASRTVPQAMFWGFVVNALLGLVLVITFLFAIPSVSDAVNDPTGYPFMYVFQQCIPNGATATFTAILLVLLTAGNISFNASTARQTFAFARDRGLPFARIIGHVDKRLMIPANAVWFSMILSIALNLIILGSNEAFNALMSLQLVALMATYGLSITVILWRRLNSPQKLPPCRWSLGRAGPLVNIVGISYCTFAFFFCFWPTANGVDVSTFNWAPVMFVVTMLLSLVLYFVRGRKVYDGPVVTVEGFLAERRLEGFGPVRHED